MKTDNKNDLVEIFDGTLFQSQMVKNLLENAGIESFYKIKLLEQEVQCGDQQLA